MAEKSDEKTRLDINAFACIFGDNDAEVTPVPIPNTVVKLCSADDTWREAARESRSSPESTRKGFGLCERYSSLAQSVEHAAVNRVVVGSSPTWGAKTKGAPLERSLRDY